MSNLSDFSTNQGLDFFLQSSLNSKVESFVFDTIEYFDEPRKGTRFNELNFLQLLHKQIENIENDLSKPYSNVQKILGLPLNEQEKHILFGFILKKFGGYPITVDPYQKISIVLKLIEIEFLKFYEDTPEKKYCLRLDSQSFIPPLNESKPESYKFTHKDVEAYSFNYDWDYYLGMDKIRNIELVWETISYFELGKRKGFVEPLTALNFIHFQKTYLNENCSKPFENLKYFKSLDIDEELRHVLYFFLVKWNGGSFSNDNQDYKRNYYLIKKELEKYEGETPEKIELGLSKTVENDPELIPIIEELSRIESVNSKFDYCISEKEKSEEEFNKPPLKEDIADEFESYFEIKEPKMFLNQLKNEFNKSDRGKSFGYLFSILVEMDILKLSSKRSNFYAQARKYLKIDIGADSGINKYFNSASDSAASRTTLIQVELIKKRLIIVLNKHQYSIKKQ